MVPRVRYDQTSSALQADVSTKITNEALERVSGNDPPSTRWQRVALPLSYTRMVGLYRVELLASKGTVLQTVVSTG